MIPRILLVNPWITDFSAYDLWARPLGLLYLAGVARHLGCEVFLVDCTDRWHESLETRPYKPRRFSCGKYPAVEIPKPSPVEWVPRRFKRYGISPEAFRRSLDSIAPPDLILVGSRMTYWYPGVSEAVGILRERFPRTPIVLGGVYPTLFRRHSERFSGADRVVAGEGENALVELINAMFKPRSPAPCFDLGDLEQIPPPAYDLIAGRDCLPFMMSRGCPRRCSYCASRFLFPQYRRRDPLRAADQLVEWVERWGFGHVAFYDDALLADRRRYFLPFAERLIASGLRARFHTPNGLDYGAIDDETAQRLYQLGFETIRLSLETADRERLRLVGRNPDLGRFEKALESLFRAGFDASRIGVYVLFGLPGQRRTEVEATVEYVLGFGVTPLLSEFSPLPLTAEWEKVRTVGSPPVEEEPLLTNNSVFYRLSGEFPDAWLNELRRRIREAKEKNSARAR